MQEWGSVARTRRIFCLPHPREIRARDGIIRIDAKCVLKANLGLVQIPLPEVNEPQTPGGLEVIRIQAQHHFKCPPGLVQSVLLKINEAELIVDRRIVRPETSCHAQMLERLSRPP